MSSCKDPHHTSLSKGGEGESRGGHKGRYSVVRQNNEGIFHSGVSGLLNDMTQARSKASAMGLALFHAVQGDLAVRQNFGNYFVLSGKGQCFLAFV